MCFLPPPKSFLLPEENDDKVVPITKAHFDGTFLLPLPLRVVTKTFPRNSAPLFCVLLQLSWPCCFNLHLRRGQFLWIFPCFFSATQISKLRVKKLETNHPCQPRTVFLCISSKLSCLVAWPNPFELSGEDLAGKRAIFG